MRLSGKTTNPGELDTFVTLYKRAVTIQAGGFPKASLGEKIDDAWVRWTNAHGSESLTVANTMGAVQVATVLMRYRAGIDNTCLVVKDAQTWEIISPDDIGERHEYIELKVKRMVSG